jgi:hypothetical protein
MTFFVDLFRSRAGTNQTVKTGTRAAGDSDEKKREKHPADAADIE